MVEKLLIDTNLSKKEKYAGLLPQIKALIYGEKDIIANLANISAALKTTFDFLWVGFYMVKNNELVLGPFQGPIACTRIKKGKGVCGASWQQANTIIVPNVDEFPNHISCSSDSKSEIVVPIFNQTDEVIMVLDVDSVELNTFDETDEKYLLQLTQLISSFC